MTDSNLNNISLGKNLLIAASIGTGALVYPSTIIDSRNPYEGNYYHSLTNHAHFDLPEGFTFNNDHGIVALENFIREISLNSRDIEPEIKAIVDKNFWEMI